jgi:hypothetical protein
MIYLSNVPAYLIKGILNNVSYTLHYIFTFLFQLEHGRLRRSKETLIIELFVVIDHALVSYT